MSHSFGIESHTYDCTGNMHPFWDEFIDLKPYVVISNNYNKSKIVDLFTKLIPNFKHIEKNKYLDDKM